MDISPQQKKAKLAIDAFELAKQQLATVADAMVPVAGDFGLTISPAEGNTAALTVLGRPYRMSSSIQGSFIAGFETWLTISDASAPAEQRDLIMFSIDADGNTDGAGATKSFVDRFGNKQSGGADKPKLQNIGNADDIALMGFAILSAAVQGMA